jgi:hypothetical protein
LQLKFKYDTLVHNMSFNDGYFPPNNFAHNAAVNRILEDQRFRCSILEASETEYEEEADDFAKIPHKRAYGLGVVHALAGKIPYLELRSHITTHEAYLLSQEQRLRYLGYRATQLALGRLSHGDSYDWPDLLASPAKSETSEIVQEEALLDESDIIGLEELERRIGEGALMLAKAKGTVFYKSRVPGLGRVKYRFLKIPTGYGDIARGLAPSWMDGADMDCPPCQSRGFAMENLKLGLGDYDLGSPASTRRRLRDAPKYVLAVPIPGSERQVLTQQGIVLTLDGESITPSLRTDKQSLLDRARPRSVKAPAPQQISSVERKICRELMAKLKSNDVY